MIRAWRQCRWVHAPGPLKQSQMTQGERGSNRVHLQGRHGLDHLMMCPTNMRGEYRPLLRLILRKTLNKLNGKAWLNVYLQTKCRAGSPGNCHWSVWKASGRLHTSWRPRQTAGWWGCWRCRRVWWDRCCTVHGSVQTWWAGPPWNPGGVIKRVGWYIKNLLSELFQCN